MDQILNSYYANNAKKLHDMTDKILRKFGGLSDKDYQDFYSLANEVFVDVMKRYDEKQSFDGFLYSCLTNKFKSEMTRLNRQKRQGDRKAISMDTLIGEDDGLTIGDTIQSDFSMEAATEEMFDDCYDEKIEKYLSSLSTIQRKIIELKMADIPVSEIKKKLELSDKQYEQHCNEIKSFEKISILGINRNSVDIEEDLKMQTAQTMEKSKSNKLSIASIIKKIDKHTIRFDHPLQRESEQWSPSMKGNLISDILQGNPIPALVFAEQVVNGIAIIWDLDGKQRCTNAYSFSKDGYKITKNIRRWMIEYQAPVVDENGKTVFDDDGFPVYEMKEFDIRGKKYSELPIELQEKFDDYNFEIVQYLNCSSEDIAYHIARYNEGKPMTAPQKGITRLGEEYAGMVKSISSMSFFKDMGGYKVSEFKNGTINRVVVESVMATNFLEDWKKKQEDMCEYIKDNATTTDFDNFEDMVGRLERVVTDDVAEMFDSKDSFLWFGLFARFIQTENDDKKFIEFMAEFAQYLHSKKINGVSYDDLSGKSTKDKNVVLGKMEHLEKLMYEYLDIKPFKNMNIGEPDDLEIFISDISGIDKNIIHENMDWYIDMLDGEHGLKQTCIKDGSRLLDKNNSLSLLSMVAYAESVEKNLDNWLTEYAANNNTYFVDQQKNFLHMKQSFDQYYRDKKSA